MDIHMNSESAEIARKYKLEYISSEDMLKLDSSLVEKLPVDWARSNAILPVRINENITILTADPADLASEEYVALLLGVETKVAVADRLFILKCIDKCYFQKDDAPDKFISGMAQLDENAIEGIADTTDDLLLSQRGSPVTQLVNLILLEAVKKCASDIHFESFADRLRVRYRIDGVLFEQSSPPKHMENAIISRLKIMARMDIAEKRLPQDGMCKVRLGEREIDIRISSVPVSEGERIVLRLLNKETALKSLSDLGMPADIYERFIKQIRHPHGMIIVCGPTGSGKTTTLYAAISSLDSVRRNILTIEDPVEYEMPNIGQIQVKPKIGLTFSNGLRHILRQDPDVVLVGETRDSETAEIAIRASLTGHLVFTTLHTNDAVGAMPRLVDMGVEPYLIASCLRVSLAQRLVRTLCKDCKRAVEYRPVGHRLFDGHETMLNGKTVYEPAGCPNCLEGYRGRTGIYELIETNDRIQEAIRSSTNEDDIRRLAINNGMQPLIHDAISKVLLGETSVSEISSSIA
jgi:general secretion pathway protein E